MTERSGRGARRPPTPLRARCRPARLRLLGLGGLVCLALACGDPAAPAPEAPETPHDAAGAQAASTDAPRPAANAPGGDPTAATPAPKRKGDGRRRVFLIGIDGASPGLVLPLIQKGRLPTMARLERQGLFGPIRSELPLYSPRIWNSIATGKDPDEHGITAFVHKDDDDAKHLYLSSDRRVPALWNIVSAAGHSVTVVNWWTTYPPEVIDGAMISDHFFPQQSMLIRNTFKDDGEISGARVYPESWAAKARDARDDTRPIVTLRNPFTEDAGLASWINTPLLAAYWETDAQVTRTAIAVEAAFSPDLSIVFLPGIDRVSHWLWGNLEPEDAYPPELRPSESERKAGAQALLEYYEYTDQLLRRLIRPADGDDLVIVLSDHGFEAGVSLMLLTGVHDTEKAIDGVFFARGPGVRRGEMPGGVSVLDVTPTILAWMGIPPAEDMKGRPMPFIEMDVPEPVASHDATPVERLAVGASGAEEAMVEHLRALGYLEGDGVDGQLPAHEDAPPGPTQAP